MDHNNWKENMLGVRNKLKNKKNNKKNNLFVLTD